MRYLMMQKADGREPTPQLYADMAAFVQELTASGVLLATGGLGMTGTHMTASDGRVTFTDGPYAETKELLGGLLVLEAKDLNHVIQLISNHPGIKMGPWEIRPAEDMTEMIRASEQRRSVAQNK